MDEFLMNQLASEPRMLQPYIMNLREVKKTWQNENGLYLPENVPIFPKVTFINQYTTQLQMRNNNLACVFQPTWSGYAKR